MTLQFSFNPLSVSCHSTFDWLLLHSLHRIKSMNSAYSCGFTFTWNRYHVHISRILIGYLETERISRCSEHINHPELTQSESFNALNSWLLLEVAPFAGFCGICGQCCLREYTANPIVLYRYALYALFTTHSLIDSLSLVRSFVAFHSVENRCVCCGSFFSMCYRDDSYTSRLYVILCVWFEYLLLLAFLFSFVYSLFRSLSLFLLLLSFILCIVLSVDAVRQHWAERARYVWIL